MKNIILHLKHGIIVSSFFLMAAMLNGCATGTSALECGAEALNPTIMSALDSFESAAISIRLSNRVLLDTPISELDKWPDELFGVPSAEGAILMGLSLLGSTQGVTIPTERDPATGFPKPTSALYIFLKDREVMLNKRVNKDDIRYFSSQPSRVIARQMPENRKKAAVDLVDDNIYRSPLMAYGVVTANRDEMLKLQQEIDLISKGFKQCDAWVHKSKEGDIKPAACKDPVLKQDDLSLRLKKTSLSPVSSPTGEEPAKDTVKPDIVNERDRQMNEKGEELETMRKNYGRLANRVYNSSVAGADFTMAALTKITCAIVNGVRAFPNAQNEIKGWKGAYNAAMLLPRVNGIINAFGYYSDNLELQFTAYKTMYQQIKGTYPDLDNNAPSPQTKEALIRIETASALLAMLEPKLQMLSSGSEVMFTDDEALRINVAAAMFPAQNTMASQILLALEMTR